MASRIATILAIAILAVIALIGAVAITASVVGGDSPANPPPAEAKAPIRGAAGDADLRALMADLAAARACALMKGQFRALRDPARPDVATGVLWIRDCRAQPHGDQVTFALSGAGWQWVEKSKAQAGGTFEVSQHVRFTVDLELPGGFDVGYDRASHILSMWFTPSSTPAARFTPVGDVEVDAQGAWSTTIGALGTIFGKSPEEEAGHEAAREGKSEMQAQLADGMAVTVNLCTGLVRYNLGRRPKGQMQPPDVGETRSVPFELQPGGMMVLGPYLAGHGMTVELEVERGAVRAAVMCRDEAEALAAAYLEGNELVDVTSLAMADVDGKKTLKAKASTCPVDVVVRAIPDATGTVARFRWKRPIGEAARSTGGPLIDCKR